MKTVSILPGAFLADFVLNELRAHKRGYFKEHRGALEEIASKVDEPSTAIQEMIAYLALKDCGAHTDLRREILNKLLADPTWERLQLDEGGKAPVLGVEDQSVKILRLEGEQYLVRDTTSEPWKINGTATRTSELKLMSKQELGERIANCLLHKYFVVKVPVKPGEYDGEVALIERLKDPEVLLIFEEKMKQYGVLPAVRKFDPFEL